MHNKKQDYQPLTVKNPFNGELVDIYPFFEFLNETENNRTSISIECAKEYTENVTKIFSTYLNEDFFQTKVSEFQSSMYYLFKNLTVYKSQP